MDPKEEVKNVKAMAEVMIGAVVTNGTSRGSKLFNITLRLNSGKKVIVYSDESENYMKIFDS